MRRARLCQWRTLYRGEAIGVGAVVHQIVPGHDPGVRAHKPAPLGQSGDPPARPVCAPCDWPWVVGTWASRYRFIRGYFTVHLVQDWLLHAMLQATHMRFCAPRLECTLHG